jgi:hypothetical protein
MIVFPDVELHANRLECVSEVDLFEAFKGGQSQIDSNVQELSIGLTLFKLI